MKNFVLQFYAQIDDIVNRSLSQFCIRRFRFIFEVLDIEKQTMQGTVRQLSVIKHSIPNEQNLFKLVCVKISIID